MILGGWKSRHYNISSWDNSPRHLYHFVFKYNCRCKFTTDLSIVDDSRLDHGSFIKCNLPFLSWGVGPWVSVRDIISEGHTQVSPTLIFRIPFEGRPKVLLVERTKRREVGYSRSWTNLKLEHPVRVRNLVLSLLLRNILTPPFYCTESLRRLTVIGLTYRETQKVQPSRTRRQRNHQIWSPTCYALWFIFCLSK